MYSHEQVKLMDAAAISICSQRHIQSVIEELIETALAAAPTPAEAPADVARDARLQVESEFAALLPGVAYMDVPDGGSPTVQEQVKCMALDAARYRWLLKQAWFQQAADRFDFTDGGLQIRFEKCMGDFIDAAMSEKGDA